MRTVRACRALTNGPVWLRCGAYFGPRWCIFELWNAIKLGRDHCDIQIILAPEDKKAFHDRINADGSDARAIDEALANVMSNEAEAFSQDDLDRIHTYIRSLPGGFTTLDSTIKNHLRRWFVSQGGVQVAARRGRSAGRANRAQPVRRDPVDRVHVAQFAASASTAAAGDPSVSRFVPNPTFDVHGMYEDMADPAAAITLPHVPMAGGSAISAAAGMPGSARRCETAGLMAPASSYTRAEVAAGAPGRPDGSIVGQGGDGGYMDVEGTAAPPERLESDDPLITDAGFVHRQESDVSLITDIGLGRSTAAASAPPRARREIMPLLQTSTL